MRVFCTFAAMNEKLTPKTWSENVILADADYIDRVTFDLMVNFERMLERRIPQADLARWIDCVALDGGLRDGAHETQVILLHSKPRLENFAPAEFTKELDGMAFKDNLGEFCISCVQVEELTTMENLFTESLQHICQQPEVKRLMVIGDEKYPTPSLRNWEGDLTVFTMQPTPACPFRQEILGYSLMAALGIKGEEITNKNK